MTSWWIYGTYRDDRRELARYRQTFIRKKGRSPLTGSAYDVFSADCGETWRNVEDVGDGRMTIKEPADEALVEWLAIESGRSNPDRGPSLLPVSLLEAKGKKPRREPRRS